MNEYDFRPDKVWLRRSFERAAAGYDEVAVLQREVGERLVERLQLVRMQPRRILDVGAGTGRLTQMLRRRYRQAEVIALDLAPAMLKLAKRRGSWWRPQPCICADAEALPLASASVDLIVSNFALHWCHDLDRTFAGFLRVLRPNGLLMFSSLGPDTLTELRQSWASVDRYQHVNAFIDMHDVGDALVRARFADPVLDVERFTLTYTGVPDLMRDLKAMGAQNVTGGRRRGLTGADAMAKMEAAYRRFVGSDGRYPATFEVVYGHAWRPERLPQRQDISGAVGIPISSIGRRQN